MVVAVVNVVGYARVSTVEQAKDGYSLDVQREQIERECARRGWTLWRLETDVASGAHEDRDGLQSALGWVLSPSAEVLMVAKLDRLSRSVMHASKLFSRAVDEDWLLVSLSPSVDMSTPYGRAMAQMAMVFAELERELMRMRVREGVNRAIAEGRPVGHPPAPRWMYERLIALWDRFDGNSAAVARQLEREGVPTVREGTKYWHRCTVRRMYERAERLGWTNGGQDPREGHGAT